MASKRMFSLSVVDSDVFLDMPLTAQAVYFHLCMRADDDGFVDNPKKIQRMVRASDDDLKILVAKQFVIPFESGVLVIKHWKMHNVIRKDTYKKTIYTEEMSKIGEDSAGRYELVTDALQTRTEPVTDALQISTTDKDRLDKTRLEKDREEENIYSSSIRDERSDYEEILTTWNQLESVGIKPIRFINGKRKDAVRARLRQYGKDAIIEAIWRIKESDFLVGKNNSGWTITFDWFMKPSNFPKVLEGNYENSHQAKSKLQQQLDDIDRWSKHLAEQNNYG